MPTRWSEISGYKPTQPNTYMTTEQTARFILAYRTLVNKVIDLEAEVSSLKQERQQQRDQQLATLAAEVDAIAIALGLLPTTGTPASTPTS